MTDDACFIIEPVPRPEMIVREPLLIDGELVHSADGQPLARERFRRIPLQTGGVRTNASP